MKIKKGKQSYKPGSVRDLSRFYHLSKDAIASELEQSTLPDRFENH